jgi:ketosteroid isomerase-like protein
MTQANIATVQSMYAAFGKGDIASIINRLTQDVQWHSGGRSSDFPAFGPRKGPKEVQAFFQIVAENDDFSHFSPREFYSAGDKVFVLGDYAMTLKKSGKTFESDWIHIFTFRDGKVSQFREFTDTAKFVEAYRG